MKRTNSGFSLVEVLIALTIFSIVLAIAYGGIGRGLGSQSDQEAVTNAQAKLRRVMEVLTQDLRSAVFGAIVDVPYPTTNTAISFALLQPEKRYTITNASSTSLTLAAGSAPQIASGTRVLAVNSAGDAAVLETNGAVAGTSSSWTVPHNTCTNTISVSNAYPLMFVIEPLGISYDAGEKMLLTKSGTGADDGEPLAFGITGFNIDYVYTSDDSTTPVMNPDGFPAPRVSVTNGGTTTNYSLTRLQVTLSAEETSRGRTFERTLTGQIELPRSSTFTIARLLTC